MANYITFEQAKWLKEKGFNLLLPYYYFEDGEFREYSLTGTNGYYGEEYKFSLSEFNGNWNDEWLTKKSGDRCFGCSKDRGYFETFSAPEQHQVVEWLRVNHGIWVQVSISRYGMFYCNILQNQATKNVDMPTSYEMISQLNDFSSPQEAYSAAFDYIKDNNLI